MISAIVSSGSALAKRACHTAFALHHNCQTERDRSRGRGMKRQNEMAPIIKPLSDHPGGMKSARSDHPAHTGTPPDSGGEEVTPKADGTDQREKNKTVY